MTMISWLFLIFHLHKVSYSIEDQCNVGIFWGCTVLEGDTDEDRGKTKLENIGTEVGFVGHQTGKEAFGSKVIEVPDGVNGIIHFGWFLIKGKSVYTWETMEVPLTELFLCLGGWQLQLTMAMVIWTEACGIVFETR